MPFPVEENEVQGVIALFREISKTSDAVKRLSFFCLKSYCVSPISLSNTLAILECRIPEKILYVVFNNEIEL